MIFPQVVRKRKKVRQETGERQEEGYTKVKSSERDSVPESKSVDV